MTPFTERRLMRYAIRSSGALFATVAIGLSAAPATPSHGEMAAAIRSANLPCHHVISIQAASENRWEVRCNSGDFLVTRSSNGEWSAARAE
jgi:hypothetical protein